MASLFIKDSYNTDHCASWSIRRNSLKNIGFDNQPIIFYCYASHAFTHQGEKVVAINPDNIWTVLFITGGNAQFQFGKSELNVRKDDIVIVGPDDTLRARAAHESKLKICQLGISDTPVIRQLLSRMHRERKLHMTEPDEIKPYLRAIEDCLEHNMPVSGRMCLRDLSVNIYALLAEIIRQCLEFESRLSVRDIRNELSCSPENNYNVTDVARKCGLSERSFERQFRALTGCSFHLFLTGCRIGYACQLLKITNYSVQEIISICNFQSVSYFYKVFRKHTGVTPCAFRGENRLQFSTELSHMLTQAVQNTDGLTANRKNMLWQIQQNPRITISEMAAQLSIQRSAVQKNIEWLKNNGFITHRGSRRNGLWYLQAVAKTNWKTDNKKWINKSPD